MMRTGYVKKKTLNSQKELYILFSWVSYGVCFVNILEKNDSTCIIIVKRFDFIISFVIRTLHDCPSQMNENLLISNSKLTSDSELIW